MVTLNRAALSEGEVSTAPTLGLAWPWGSRVQATASVSLAAAPATLGGNSTGEAALQLGPRLVNQFRLGQPPLLVQLIRTLVAGIAPLAEVGSGGQQAPPFK